MIGALRTTKDVNWDTLPTYLIVFTTNTFHCTTSPAWFLYQIMSDFMCLHVYKYLWPELESRVESSQALAEEANTRLSVTEAKVAALEKNNQGLQK